MIDVNKGPFSAFTEKKTASLMQKFIIVPWNIAIHGLSYAKKLTKKKDIKAQVIAIIDSENLMPGFPDCAEQASKHSVLARLVTSTVSYRRLQRTGPPQ